MNTNDASMRVLDALAKAWNDQDVEAALACFGDDAVYHDAFGPDALGASHRGLPAIRDALVATFAAFPKARLLAVGGILAAPDGRAASEWLFEHVDAGGARHELHGCDIYLIEGGKVKVKNAFVKCRIPGASN